MGILIGSNDAANLKLSRGIFVNQCWVKDEYVRSSKKFFLGDAPVCLKNLFREKKLPLLNWMKQDFFWGGGIILVSADSFIYQVFLNHFILPYVLLTTDCTRLPWRAGCFAYYLMSPRMNQHCPTLEKIIEQVWKIENIF